MANPGLISTIVKESIVCEKFCVLLSFMCFYLKCPKEVETKPLADATSAPGLPNTRSVDDEVMSGIYR